MCRTALPSRARRVRSARVVAVLVLLAAPPTVIADLRAQDTAAPGRVTLRLAPRPGARSEYRHEKRLELRLPQDLGGDVATRTVLRLAQEVEETSADSVVFEAEIVEIRFEAEPAPPDLPDLGGLKGLRFRLVTTPAGRLYRVDLPGATGPVARALRDQVESWLRELGFPALPVGPVRVGDSWSDTTRVPLATLLGLRSEAEAVEVRTTTLEAIEGSPGARTARLAVRTAWSGREGPEDAPDLAVEGAGSQEVELELEAGRFTRAVGTSRVQVLVFDGTGAPPRRIEAAGRQETRLVAEDGGR
jgi:hypothetical protein